MPPWALVGGLAVMVHISEAHRATHDVDAAVNDEGRPQPVVEMLVARQGATGRSNGVRLTDGVDVDIISVGA